MYNIHTLNETIINGFTYNALYIISLLSILCGIMVIISKNPIVSILFLIGLFFNIAGYLMMLGINFIGLSYLLVYVGAVSILFLFILMLINVRISELLADNINNSDVPSSSYLTNVAKATLGLFKSKSNDSDTRQKVRMHAGRTQFLAQGTSFVIIDILDPSGTSLYQIFGLVSGGIQVSYAGTTFIGICLSQLTISQLPWYNPRPLYNEQLVEISDPLLRVARARFNITNARFMFPNPPHPPGHYFLVKEIGSFSRPNQ